MRLPHLSPLLLGLLATACGDPDGASPPAEGLPAAPGPGAFPNEAEARGIRFHNRSGGPEKATVLEANGPGVALLDLGGDGDLDLVLSQGLASPAELVAGPGARLYVALNDGEGVFSEASGPETGHWWTGLAAGDLDGDGRSDLVAGAFGDLVPFFQSATGRLEPRPGAGLAPPPDGRRLVPGEDRTPGTRPPSWFTSLALLDADRDGDLDLFAGRYLDLDPLDPPLGEVGAGTLSVPCWWKGREVFCGPRGLVPQSDLFFENAGDGSFGDAGARWLPADLPPAYTLGVVPFDADGDGDLDLYVAADSAPNQLLVNGLASGGRFTDRALGAGVAVNLDGLPEAGMGVDAADVNRDGRMDLVVTNFSDEATQLHVASDVGFRCESYRLGLASLTRRRLSWGVHLEDFDGDGRHELFHANGHVYPQADGEGTGTTYAQPDTFLRLGEGGYEPWPLSGPNAFDDPSGSRGSAVGDLDGDGAPDLVIARIDDRPALAMNRLAPNARRLALRCLGPESPTASAPRTPRDGTGTRVVVAPSNGEGPEQLGEVRTSRGYQSASTPWLHFGFGDAERHGTITILWPSGRREELPAGATGRRLTVREGQGVVAEEAL